MHSYVNLVNSSFQILSHKDLQRGRKILYFTYLAILLTCRFLHCLVINPGFFLPLSVCMFLEDSAVGRRVWRQYHLSLLNKVSELLGVALQQEALRDGPLCYTAVKVHGEQHQSLMRDPFFSLKFLKLMTSSCPFLAQVCLQAFQLLSSEVAPLVWDKTSSSAVLQEILQVLVDLILGEVCHKKTSISIKFVLEIHDWRNCSQRVLSFCVNLCLVVLQQGHTFSGRHCCVHADQHGTRGCCRRSRCLESDAGLSLW